MSYFSKNYNNLTYPIASSPTAADGFRLSQLAAIHAVGAHFFSRTEPAIVVMPTGSGKSAIISAIPFVLRATRVLVLTPSRLVREQLAENFQSLVDLHKLGAIPSKPAAPKVATIGRYLKTQDEWVGLREFDVVVATVPSVSPKSGTVADPPEGLFDLVLVDEAHHAPARTWAGLLTQLNKCRQVLFTATPFRRDEKDLKGRIVFRYELRKARDDKVFGNIEFEAVPEKSDEPIDVTIARATESRLKADIKAGFDHRVMVRADTITRAKELHQLYGEKTSLRLEFVSGAYSLRKIKQIIKKLEDNEADGIVCVNMFGEGFNMPRLKVAAIHSPHKSLSVTLQFIGRFARVGHSKIGAATFLAEPHESAEELGYLYESGSTWRELVANLNDSRVDDEVSQRETMDSFRTSPLPDLADFSLYTVQPYCHAKLYRVANFNLNAEPGFPPGLEVVFRGFSDSRGTAVYITRSTTFPLWSADERFANVAYDLFIFHYCAAQELLFICASQRTAKLYDRLIRSLALTGYRPLSASGINRILRNLKELTVVNLGLRSRNLLGVTESYQQRTGPRVDRTVQASDARRFDRGHVYATAKDRGRSVTVGLSASAKIWRNSYLKLPQLLQVFDEYAKKIADPTPFLTGTGLDTVQPGQELASVPDQIFAWMWGVEVYDAIPQVWWVGDDGEIIEFNILDFDLSIKESEEGRCDFTITSDDRSWTYRFQIGGGPLIVPVDALDDSLFVREEHSVGMSEYLSDVPPVFYRRDLSRVEGTNLYLNRVPAELFDRDAIEAVDWGSALVDITSEKDDTKAGRSIFSWVIDRAKALGDKLVFCDDNAGEVADFISANCDLKNPVVRFFHCKSSDKPEPGARQTDFFEVLGQAVRSSPWFDLERLARRLEQRRKGKVRGLVVGGETEFSWLGEAGIRSTVKIEVYVVQPGLAKNDVSAAILELLASTANFLQVGGAARFGVIASLSTKPGT